MFFFDYVDQKWAEYMAEIMAPNLEGGTKFSGGQPEKIACAMN